MVSPYQEEEGLFAIAENPGRYYYPDLTNADEVLDSLEEQDYVFTDGAGRYFLTAQGRKRLAFLRR